MFWLLIQCPGCGRRGHGTRVRHQSTMFPKYELNYILLCDDCNRENEAYWRDMWEDYYSSILGSY